MNTTTNIYLPTPLELGLPEKFSEFRPEQETILKRFISTRTNLMVEAPWGVGKSLVGVAAQMLERVPAAYTTPNISLQHQICKDFPQARMVMGRSNYECLLYRGLSATVCSNSKEEPCPYVIECPYLIARKEAENAELAVLNSTYYLYASNYAKLFRRHLLIIDEVDQFESALVSFVSIDLTTKDLRLLAVAGYSTPNESFTVEDWQSWAADSDSCLSTLIKQSKDVQETERLKRLRSKLYYMREHVDSSWFTEVNSQTGAITFRPVLISKYASNLVWENHQRVLGMSATILNHSSICSSLGLEAESISVSCPYPRENRPIIDLSPYLPENLKGGNWVEYLSTITTIVERIIDSYPEGKILIHTHSEALNNALFRRLRKGRVITHFKDDSKGRQEVIDEFLTSTKPLVLLSFSCSRGLDLAGASFPCVVVIKAPFASLGNLAVSKRMKLPGGQKWYMEETASTFVQQCGRGVRSVDDQCDVYYIDGNCNRLFALCPNWFKTARKEHEG